MKSSAITKVVFLGKKSGAAKAATFLLSQNIAIAAIVARRRDSAELFLLAEKHNIPIFEDDAPIYEMIENGELRDVDLVISYLYWRKIKMSLISLGKRGCLNFHPAPLPDYKGLAGYNTAILDRRTMYGVSAHVIDSEEFDQGPIVATMKFPIDAEVETAWSLEKKAQEKLFLLFTEVITLFSSGKPIPTKENKGGVALTQKEFEALKVINLAMDSPELILRKIRAFFFPPYTGAHIIVGGKRVTLVTDELLATIQVTADKKDI